MADSNNITKMLTALLGPMTSLQDTLRALLTERRVDTAVGAQLDVLGKIVGEARAGATDDVYRRHIRARIAANRSNGTTNDIIRVATLVIDDEDALVHVIREGVAATTVVIEDAIVDQSVANIALAFLGETVSAGVRLILETWPAVESNLFAFAPFTGSSTRKGFGSTLDATVGGVLASGMST